MGRIFASEAPLRLAVAVVLYALVRRHAREAALAGAGSPVSTDVLLVLGTLFCTVAGYYALQPMMAPARAGQGAWSFGALHAASLALFSLKGLLLLLLAWRLTRCR
jgi:hypothetical protein